MNRNDAIPALVNQNKQLLSLVSTMINDLNSLRIADGNRTEFSDELHGCIEGWKEEIQNINTIILD